MLGIILSLSLGMFVEPVGQVLAVKGGPPTIKVNAVTTVFDRNSLPPGQTCGVEFTFFLVTWTATIPTGTTITGFTVNAKVTLNGQTTVLPAQNLPASAHQSNSFQVFTSALQGSAYTADVQATYTSVVNGSVSGTIP